MKKRVFLITGAPGVGKTTVFLKTVDALKARGISIGGMVSREVRQKGVRVGFEIVDLDDGKKGWLAHINQSGPQVGKYHVNVEDLEKIGAKAIESAVKKCTVVAVDEVGPMELYSEKFKQAAEAALNSSKTVLAVIHAKAKDPLIVQAKQRLDMAFFRVTLANREVLAQELVDAVGDAVLV